MAITLDERTQALLKGVNFGHIATINRDGSPQVSPVWVDYDGTHVIVNSEQTRKKVRNLKRNPRVSISIADAANPYSYREIRGRVVEITPTGGFEGIDRLSLKYTGQEKYPGNQPGDVRVVIRIEPEHVAGMN